MGYKLNQGFNGRVHGFQVCLDALWSEGGGGGFVLRILITVCRKISSKNFCPACLVNLWSEWCVKYSSLAKCQGRALHYITDAEWDAARLRQPAASVLPCVHGMFGLRVCARAANKLWATIAPKIMFFFKYVLQHRSAPPPSLPHPPIPPSDHRCVKIGIPQLPCGSKKRDHLHVRAKCSTRHDDDATIEHDLRSSCLTAEDAPRAGQTRIYIHILALKKNRSCIYSVNQ